MSLIMSDANSKYCSTYLLENYENKMKNRNLLSFLPSGHFIRLFFTILYLFLLNICTYRSYDVLELHLSNIYSRKLAEASSWSSGNEEAEGVDNNGDTSSGAQQVGDIGESLGERSLRNEEDINVLEIPTFTGAPYGSNMGELFEELSEEEILEKLDALEDPVTKKEVYTIWFILHRYYRRKFLEMKTGLWEMLLSISRDYRINYDNRMNVWWQVNDALVKELLEWDFKEFNNIKDILRTSNLCNKRALVDYINSKRNSWDIFTSEMKSEWSAVLENNLMNYYDVRGSSSRYID